VLSRCSGDEASDERIYENYDDDESSGAAHDVTGDATDDVTDGVDLRHLHGSVTSSPLRHDDVIPSSPHQPSIPTASSLTRCYSPCPGVPSPSASDDPTSPTSLQTH